MRVLEFDGVDEIDAEIAVHGFITKYVHVLIGGARHFFLATQRKYLRKTNIKEQTFHQASKNNQRFKQGLVGLRRACLEVGVGNGINEWNQEFIFGAYGRHFVVGIEDLGFIEIQAFDDVLVSVRVYGFFKGLAQQELPAFRCGDVSVGAEHNVVGGQRIGRDEEAKVALYDAALVFGQAIWILPQ